MDTFGNRYKQAVSIPYGRIQNTKSIPALKILLKMKHQKMLLLTILLDVKNTFIYPIVKDR